MIFTACQLVEKAIEHQAKQFFLFIDVKKVYNSMPQTAMWRDLEKFGIPDCVINIIRSFHKGIYTKVHIGGKSLEQIPIKNGLRQGCTMHLFSSTSACLIAKQWSAKVKDDEGMGSEI